MKRYLAVRLSGAACVFAGLSTGLVLNARAQVVLQSERDAQFGKAVNGKAIYLSAEEIKNKLLSGPPAGKDRINNLDGNIAWDPAYRFSVLSKPYYDPPKKFPSGEVSHWEGPEMHEDKTQIYIIIGGTGNMALGGTPPKDHVRNSAEGQHTSCGPLEGTTLHKFGPGDWIVVPPMTWHQSLPDPGQTIVYGMVHIETRNTRP